MDHCADRSDEWNCIKLENKDADEKTAFVQILTTNNTWYPICSTSWNSTFSDKLCKSLGYANSSSTQNTPLPSGLKTDKYWRLTNASHYKSNILTNIELTDSCSEEIVAVTCQEYGKYYLSSFYVKVP